MIEIVAFTKANGPLTKRIFLNADGTLSSNGSLCLMAKGIAQRTFANSAKDLAALIESVNSDQALALGALRPDLADHVSVVTKNKLNGAANVIARTADAIKYRPAEPAWLLIDYDRKGMPAEIRKEVKTRGGLWPTLVSILPALRTVEHVERWSTSAGLRRTDTNALLPFSGGQHVYLLARNGADSERFLRALHERCWLAGFGWYIVSASGQLLERSIIDRMVGPGERLVFEGPPILDPPLTQDSGARKPKAFPGDPLDTMAACPPVTVVETSRLREIKTKARALLQGDADKARRSHVDKAAQDLSKSANIPVAAARHIITQQCEGVLLPDLVLPFDDDDFKGCTVRDVLADPEKFEGATLADPREGVAYGRCVAKVMRRADGTPWIHSFAHGRAVYDLKHNFATVAAAIAKASAADVARVFVEYALDAKLDANELTQLRKDAAKRAGIGLRDVAKMLKDAVEERAKQRKRESEARRISARQDPRPRLPCPPEDAEWLPQMSAINEVVGASPAIYPPGRDIETFGTSIGKVAIGRTHAFTPDAANGTTGEAQLPTPEQWVIKRLTLEQTAEMIERHVEYVNDEGRSVHLPTNFVRHYMKRDDGALPTYVAVATLPIVAADGDVIGREEGLDRLRGIAFIIPPEVRACVPEPGTVRDTDVARSMKFLTDEWLVDVATDYSGKCIIIAAGLTLIERSLLDERPTFFITAGRRGGGKTTTLTMLIRAIMGVSPAASAWSKSEEERRKALLSYFLQGVAYVLWDNVERGARLSCPHIEKACTTGFYADRKLGASEMATAAASAIHLFTGNNIAPTGDMASRSLLVKLELERADPENRTFKHPNAIGWTDTNRANILGAFFTILMGNPTLTLPRDAPMKTRFKMWWRLVGSAIEHAAKLAAPRYGVDFQKLFLARDEDDDEAASLADVLDALRRMWPADQDLVALGIETDLSSDSFTAADMVQRLNETFDKDEATVREFLYPEKERRQTVLTPKSAGKRLQKHLDEPIRCGGETLVLKATKDTHANLWRFSVKSIPTPS
jgi:hypothetical protein